MVNTKIPPIKSQGIKTKLVDWIASIAPCDFKGNWIEPFSGTGVVGFNVAPRSAIMCDANPHLVNFYNAIAAGTISGSSVRRYLEHEGSLLATVGESHYYFIRDRFNLSSDPLDFLFLNRAGFNGMIRFNRKGQFNIPFCRKPGRFSKAYITKIVNQVDWVSKLLRMRSFTFREQDFRKTISDANSTDILYCDPPYIDRHVDYYNSWDHSHEMELFNALASFKGRFILSTWHHNDFRKNEYVSEYWAKFNVLTRGHYYHVGGREENRNPVVEAIITNFDVPTFASTVTENQQLSLAAV